MKKTIGPRALFGFLFALQSFTLHAPAQVVSSFDDLNYWGSGANRSAVVIQWNDSQSPQALAWGYRWDDPGTLFDMLAAITVADPALFLRVDSFTTFGPGLYGIGYQNGSNPFSVTGAQDPAGNPAVANFVDGIWDINATSGFDAPASSTGTAPAHAGDRYQEGWNDNGFWGLYFSGTNVLTAAESLIYPAIWAEAWVGVGGADLVNNGWYGLSFAADFVNQEPGAALAAIPEPSIWSLWLLGGALLIRLRRR